MLQSEVTGKQGQMLRDYSSPEKPGSDNCHHIPVPVYWTDSNPLPLLQAVSESCADFPMPRLSLQLPDHSKAEATGRPAPHPHIFP